MLEPTGRGRGEGGDEAALGQAAHPVAEHPGRERPARHDDPGPRGRIGELCLDDRVQREVAERSVAVPALVSGLGEHPQRPGGGVELRPALEPFEPSQAVAGATRVLGVEEVVGDHAGVLGGESERGEPPKRRAQPVVRLGRLRRQAEACG